MPILVIAFTAIILLLLSGFYMYKKTDNQLYLVMIGVGLLMLIMLAAITFLYFDF